MEEEQPLQLQKNHSRAFLSNFTKDKKLGEGTYGVVSKRYDNKRK